MRKLILIKHAKPQVNTDLPPEEWSLSDEGKKLCVSLAEKIQSHRPATLLSSTETKAIETAQLIAPALSLTPATANDLFEHDRSNEPHMDTREFISLIALFFQKPDELVLGLETADEAYDRFAGAVDSSLAAHPGDLAIVTHGTVIALFLQRRCGQDPFQAWRRMGLPSFIVLDTSTWTPIDQQDRF